MKLRTLRLLILIIYITGTYDMAMATSMLQLPSHFPETSPSFRFQLAIYNGDIETVKAFLNAGVNVNEQKDVRGYSPLMSAVSSNYYDLATRLLEHGADVNAENNWGETALFIAVNLRPDDLKMAKTLLSLGADVNKQTKNGRTPLMAASTQCNASEARELLSDYSDLSDTLNKSSQCSPSEFIKLLLDHGADPNIKDNSGMDALSLAIEANKLENVRKLVIGGAQINPQEHATVIPLIAAVKRDRLEIVEMLLSMGAYVNVTDAENTTPLIVAALHNRIKLAKTLLAAGADVNVKSRNSEILSFIITDEGKREVKKRGGITALLLAQLNKNMDFVDLLIKAGARD